MLQQKGRYNDLSPELRQKIAKHVESLGSIVRYDFHLGRINPDPEPNPGQKILYPEMWTLGQVVFDITDPYEKRSDKDTTKTIALVEKIDNTVDKNDGDRFTHISVRDRQNGMLEYNTSIPEQKDIVAYLECHPKNGDGLFPSPLYENMYFNRIDQGKLATDQRTERKARKTAMDYAEQMSDKEVVDFADSMGWKSSGDINQIRNDIEAMAETTPEMFNDKVDDKETLTIKSTLKKAIDNKVIAHNPAEGSLLWASTGQNIITLGVSGGGKSDLERFAEWFKTGGNKAESQLKKISSLLEKPQVAQMS